MAEGIAALHEYKPQIIHRDLKTLNLLVTKDWRVKVCDFGLSRPVAGDLQTFTKLCGTLAYCAPEIFSGSSPASEKSDVFSMGICIWELFNTVAKGRYEHPYQEFGLSFDFQIGLKSASGDRPSIPSQTPIDFALLYHDCVNPDPSARPSARAVALKFIEIKEEYEKDPAAWGHRVYQPNEAHTYNSLKYHTNETHANNHNVHIEENIAAAGVYDTASIGNTSNSLGDAGSGTAGKDKIIKTPTKNDDTRLVSPHKLQRSNHTPLGENLLAVHRQNYEHEKNDSHSHERKNITVTRKLSDKSTHSPKTKKRVNSVPDVPSIDDTHNLPSPTTTGSNSKTKSYSRKQSPDVKKRNVSHTKTPTNDLKKDHEETPLKKHRNRSSKAETSSEKLERTEKVESPEKSNRSKSPTTVKRKNGEKKEPRSADIKGSKRRSVASFTRKNINEVQEDEAWANLWRDLDNSSHQETWSSSDSKSQRRSSITSSETKSNRRSSTTVSSSSPPPSPMKKQDRLNGSLNLQSANSSLSTSEPRISVSSDRSSKKEQ